MDNELFELMTKMYAEMQDGFKKVNVEIQEIKKDVSGLKEDVSGLKEDVSGLKQGQDSLKKDLKEFRKETNKRFDNLGDQLNEIEGINASNHIVTNTKLNKVSSDLDFLSHKEFQTEREMFNIKQKLNKQRRNIR